ncbi:uncharacterized protein LOC143293100 [Babylonia areolata]|uniref:uncharacterized protein LOC143293100 n=1 Tax=Babylonia areolata TaxID=304850 RepID=UPI003FD293AF
MNTLILLCSLLAVTAAGFLKKDNPHTPKHPHTPKAPNPPKAPKAPHDSGYDNYGYGDSGYGDSGYGDPHGHHGSGYGYGNSYGPGYGHSGGYGYGSHGSRRGSHGYGRGGFAGRGGHGNVGSTPHGEKPLDELDKLYGNVADMLAKVKALSEQVEAISAALSIQEKELNNLELIFVELKETDARHDSSINKLHKHLDNVFDDAKSLEEHLTGLKKLNFVNTGLTEKVENKWAELQKVNIRQDGNFQALFAIVKDLKPKLFQVKSNNFQIFSNDLERDTTKLSSVKTYETRRMCK